MGFGIPIGEWLKGPLKEWAEDLLDPKKMNDENLLNSVEIQKKWIEHKLGIFNWGYLLWDVLMFQSWLRNEKQINE
jgi:asparagine synthase (glutamine-hydrolysing)